MTAGRRVHERYERHLKVVLKAPAAQIECVTRNISLGGMYLVTEERLDYGTEVSLQFFLPALKETVELGATVRWVKDDGLGVQFGPLRAREVWGLNQLFKSSPKAD